MSKLLDEVKRAGVFYIATAEGDTPHVRPFGAIEEIDGKIYLESKSRIAVSPNGNGGWYDSLKKAGLYEDLQRRHTEYISVFAVDNVCQRINDPSWVGAMVSSGCACAGKVVRKTDPNERVGVLCLEDGRPSIVEYYEMTDDMIHLRDDNGELSYAFGVILNYMFRVDKLEEITGKSMMVHAAKKKIPHLDDNGEFVRPEEPNGYKFELLVLDMIHLMDSCLSYEIDRDHEFAPVKNASGVDSVESARKLLKKNGVAL